MKLKEPISKFIVTQYRNNTSSANNFTPKPFSTISVRTKIGMPESCAVSLFLSFTRDSILFQVKLKLRKRRRLQNISMETHKGVCLYPERYQMLYIPIDGPHSNPERTIICGDPSPSFGNTTRRGSYASDSDCDYNDLAFCSPSSNSCDVGGSNQASNMPQQSVLQNFLHSNMVSSFDS